MKNWILWLVVSLIFIAGAVTFFILWKKEKDAKVKVNTGTADAVKAVANAVSAATSTPVNTPVSNVVTTPAPAAAVTGAATAGRMMFGQN